MALQIKNNAGVYEINGELNSQNINSLNNHFKTLIEKSRMITISLNQIKEIDKTAVNAISNLYKKALSENKIFYIIGQENEKVNQLFQTEKLNYILRRDVL
jgi:ABC-type transporter Mla MlaB component